jgi:hypothetical protein
LCFLPRKSKYTLVLFVKYKKTPRKTYTNLVLCYYNIEYGRDIDIADENGEEGESIPLAVMLLPLGVLAFIPISLYCTQNGCSARRVEDTRSVKTALTTCHRHRCTLGFTPMMKDRLYRPVFCTSSSRRFRHDKYRQKATSSLFLNSC